VITTRDAVITAVTEHLPGSTQTRAAQIADAAIEAYETTPPDWLLEAIREVHRRCLSELNPAAHTSGCLAFPVAMRHRAGVLR
jgi:hypothetical protein